MDAQNAEQDQKSLNDAESLWQMTNDPVYGDPMLLGEEFIDLSIRFAQRGLRWAQMAQSVGISAADRRSLSEMGARNGYGKRRPANPAPLFDNRVDFDRTKAQYMEPLRALIVEHRAESLRNSTHWVAKRCVGYTSSA